MFEGGGSRHIWRVPTFLSPLGFPWASRPFVVQYQWHSHAGVVSVGDDVILVSGGVLGVFFFFFFPPL